MSFSQTVGFVSSTVIVVFSSLGSLDTAFGSSITSSTIGTSSFIFVNENVSVVCSSTDVVTPSSSVCNCV